MKARRPVQTPLRYLCLFLLLYAPAGMFAQDFPFENPVKSKFYDATFSHAGDGTELVLTDKSGATLLEQNLPKQDVQSARWTNDGKFLVMTARNSEGHSPWRYQVFVYSVDAGQVRARSDERDPPCISADIWCQSPNAVILVGHTFAHKIAAPDDPILLHYSMTKLWPYLKKM